MSNDSTIRDGFARFDAKMCPTELYINFYDGLCKRIQVSGFYANCLQYGLVTLMYFNVGKGKYWKILYYAALSGLIGGLIENGTVAYVCTQSDMEVKRYKMIPFLINEIFWIVKEYSVPFLNLIKLNAFTADKKYEKITDYLIYSLFVLFIGCRINIGYIRMTTGLLSTPQSKIGHTCAFLVIAVADIICTISILYYVNKHNRQNVTYANNIDHYIQRSSYFTLIFVDLIGIILAFFNFTTAVFNTNFPSSYINPFQAIKSSFILILACDAMVFKYSVVNSSKSQTNYYNTNYSKENFSNNGYTSLSQKMNQSKTIVKNYSSNNINGSSKFYDIDSSSNATDRSFINYGMTSQPFGFLSGNR
ncbi:hypothetical protein H8356DRAFT_978619 [Neocallimastix lanati (nom. inval.)]|jgi:hypothetical protein|uniref:Uncharacterized protein n=1 Tax=Neocallimastix californiae TaxID=1754190 RepID=A0A1Y2AGN1_9FUNG|nr:hypothetical protein H8356DRAFT_978619 [Neocallimastix sp. JGI-2020a]ORY21450.1 hypothetical protein LY90DRAFT_516105 [Neocallimastix californiae]|eukprot:ORY21450.1 hypothetical protein LY90DRAFT_516105 [Neocallimastix californiae]